VYPNDRVSKFINENFVPIKIHIKENKDAFGRFGAQWTPTLIVLDPEGKERYRFEGFLPPDDFLAQLETGLARSAFERGELQEAERRYREIAQQHPKSEAAPEALYWAGVSKYKATNDPAPLGQAAQELKQQYPESSWAKKASVWGG
jgi:thioredoxin family protein/tetratricopeptide repeat protein